MIDNSFSLSAMFGINETTTVTKSEKSNNSTEVKPDSPSKIEPQAKDTKTISAKQGNAVNNINILSSTSHDPIIKLDGFKSGDKFNVDGPLWYDGTGSVKKFDENSLELNLQVKAPSLVSKSFIPINGKINVDVKLSKEKDGTYTLRSIDNNDHGRGYTQKHMQLNSNGKNFILTDPATGKKTTFKLTSSGNISIKTPDIPTSIDIIKSK